MNFSDDFSTFIASQYIHAAAQSLSLCLTLNPKELSHQAPLVMEFSRQEYWSGLPFPISGDLPNPQIEPMSLASPALTGRFSTTVPPWVSWLVVVV